MKKVILLSIFMLGCAERYKMPDSQVGQLRVTYEHDVTRRTADFVPKAVKTTLNTWQRNNKTISRPALVSVTQYPYIYINKRTYNIFGLTLTTAGKKVLGAFFAAGDVDTIKVTAGRFDICGSLYHELCHLNFARKDPDHTDPRWDRWDEEAFELKWQLRSLWFQQNY